MYCNQCYGKGRDSLGVTCATCRGRKELPDPCPDCGQEHSGTPCQPLERELPDPEDEDPTPSWRNTL